MLSHIYFIILGVCVVSVQSETILEFLVGPRLGEKINSTEETNTKSTEEIVRSYGYRLDIHLVASETGHILTLHRIPRGRKLGNDTKAKPVALIHHGLFGSSDMWLLRGPQLDLPYFLADSGYDVWLFNIRGNIHSRKHKFLNPDKDADYWNFGIEEIGYYDLPVTIDYILNITKQKDLFFLGHSLGSSVGFITCSMHPEYNKKIRLFLGLGPLANVKHKLNPTHKIEFSIASSLIPYVNSREILEIMSLRPHITKMMQTFCKNESPFHNLCLLFVFSIVGEDYQQLDNKSFLALLAHYPAGTSLKLMSDVVQYYITGKFSRHDYGISLNRIYYNTTAPPMYDLSKVTAPVSLHYGPGDILVTEDDIDDLSRQLPKFVGKFRIPYKHFNHLDFVLALNARSVLYETLLALMAKYK